MKKFSKCAVLTLSSLASMLALTDSFATSYQVFANLNFANPAALNSVQNGEGTIGGLTLASRFHMVGTANGVQGSTTSYTDDVLPYGRLAARVSPKLVFGLDITQPYYTNIQYPRNSFINLFSTESVIRVVNYSPKLSWQTTDKLALGIGLDASNMYNGQLNFLLPPFQMVNKAESWAYGFDVGALYMATHCTIFSLAYYSSITHHANGTSKWGPFINNHFRANVRLPATAIGNVVQMVNPSWALSATVRYAWWNILQFVTLENTALPGGTNLLIPYKYYSNFSYELATHYQLNQKWGALGAIDYEPSVQPTYTRNPGLPSYNRLIPAVGVDYELIKGLKAKLIYAHVFSKPVINMAIATGQRVQGHDYVNVDAVDFSMTYDF